MDYRNDATRIRREVLIRLIKAYSEGSLAETVDRIPYIMRPKKVDVSRCCVYKDRAMLRYRLLAAMGFGVEDEHEEWIPLADFATKASERKHVEGPILTVLDTACQGCAASRYLVTDACQGCTARPCVFNCAFDAIVVKNGQARIDPKLCHNCGKCQKVCPFNAITRIPVPCQEACPVDAISREEDGKAKIDFEKCIHCGRCLGACPFGAVMEKSQVLDVLRVLQEARPVVAMVAPSIVGQFPGKPEQIVDALQCLGFDSVVEVAWGADRTAKLEAAELAERMENSEPFMTTSCCPAFVEAVHKHMPTLMPYVSKTATPMHYTAEWVKMHHPNAVTVFIGPCVTKRCEAMKDDMVDYVLTFEEVGAMFVAKDIEVEACNPLTTILVGSAEGRGFAIAGGVAESVRKASKNQEVKPVSIQGLDLKSIKRLREFAATGKCPGNLVEVMACEGGCIGGAGAVGNVRVTSRSIADWIARTNHREPCGT